MVDLWNEMLDEFRALGGIADNICLKEGRFGRGLFPCDPLKPIRVRVPENLLIDMRYLAFVNDEFRIAPDAPVGGRERAFIENYERDFSWGAGRQHTEELLRMIGEAPPELRALLDTPFGLDDWLTGPTPQAIQEQFLAQRVIRTKNQTVVMPIIELANYGRGTEYRGEAGVEISGQFSGEILVHYEVYDPLEIFRHWGFASENELLAFSLPLKLESKSGTLRIGRDVGRSAVLTRERKPFVPEVSAGDGGISLSYLMLGNKDYPRLARGIFQDIMRRAGRTDVEETFDLLQHLNRLQFHNLIAASETASPPLARLLRTVTRYQLECMSYSIGTGQV